MIVPKIPGSKVPAHFLFVVLVIALVFLCKGRTYDLKTALESPPGEKELGYQVELKARKPGEHVDLNTSTRTGDIKRRDLEAAALVVVDLVTDSELNLNLNLNLTRSLRRSRRHRSTI